jgi:hypothetical protein
MLPVSELKLVVTVRHKAADVPSILEVPTTRASAAFRTPSGSYLSLLFGQQLVS